MTALGYRFATSSAAQFSHAERNSPPCPPSSTQRTTGRCPKKIPLEKAPSCSTLICSPMGTSVRERLPPHGAMGSSMRERLPTHSAMGLRLGQVQHMDFSIFRRSNRSRENSGVVALGFGSDYPLYLSRNCDGESPMGRSVRERLPHHSPMGMGVGRIEYMGWTIFRRSDHIRETSSVMALGFGGHGPLYLLGDYDGDGPIELPPREIDPLAIPEASPAQIVASVFLTGAIVLLLFRSLRRRTARSKDMQFRSSGVSTSESIKEEARKALIDNLKKSPEVPAPLPSPAQTAFGALVAGVIALGLYKFTTTVEDGFSTKVVSQDYSIRNLTITVRTIITGLCYLATFVFAANSIGLALYSIQLLSGFGVSNPSPPNDSSKSEESKSGEKLDTDDFSEK